MRPFIICCMISLLLLTFYIREGETGPIHGVRSVVTTITTPVRMVGSIVASPFHAVGNVISNVTAPQETLSELRQRNEQLTAEVAKLTEAEKTAERLEGLLGLRSTYSLESTAARIVGGSSDAWSHTVMIDKGTVDGLEVGMAVCNSGGAIGQIVEVSATSSTVRLLTDETSGISAMVQRSRAQGILQGQPDGSLQLNYITADSDVSVGDIVITSGLGGVFPKGLPLGTVTSVNRASNATYYTVTVRAQSLAENNEEVLVITSVSAEQAASSEDVASANAQSAGVAPAPAADSAGKND
ncbi:rod shape-determining protein MreC [Collinsella sp. BA40]|uniref:rod shape-determining protein MreC n=1 Tax=Collinsella sp. BA40 TaxID=2560852 RepID=UPI0011C95320|nr:rod shape-determining protein MreC [Collinsella sp. BA40]TXF36707.1 rod shape-determining protein MreC [Collinsella sp. BA40]